MNAPTVRQIVQAYLDHCKRNSVHSAESRTQRQHRLGIFIDAYGKLPVTELKAHHLIDLIESQPKVKSPSTRRAWAIIVKACFTWAVKEERISRNPFLNVNYQEAEPRPPMSDDAFADLCNCGSKRFERAVRFLRLTGCRLSEMTQLTWADIDLDKGIALAQKHKTRKQTKKPRVLVLVPEVVTMLREIQARQPKGYDGVVFLNNRGTPWTRSTLGQTVNRMKRRGELSSDASLHGLRHSFGHSALANGASLALVAQAMGHSSPLVTFKSYGHLSQAVDAVRGAAELAKPGDSNG